MKPEHTVAPDGSWEKWEINERCYRKDGPAYIRYKDNKIILKEWYSASVPGVRHREDGPAIIRYLDNQVIEEEWWFEGWLHREDGPAVVIYKDGKIVEKEWWMNHKRHRENGPAYIGRDDEEEWWLNDKLLSKEDFKSLEMIERMEAYRLFSPIEIAKMKKNET